MKKRNIPLFKVHMPKTVVKPLLKTLFSGYITEGPRVKEFEKKINDFLRTKYALSTNNGTNALLMALRLAGVNTGDEVISSPMTCIATNMPVINIGAKLKWADINARTGNIDPNDIENLITDKTKAILYVHWAGFPAEIDKINKIARKHNLKVIEDACHTFGGEYRGRMVGTHSDFAVFSFQAIKHINTINGGCLVCKKKEDYKKAKLMRWFGINRDVTREELKWHYDIKGMYGYKYHMDDVCATVGIEQMKYIKKILKIHRRNGEYYNKALQDIKGVETLEIIKGANPAYWLYTLLVDKREKFVKHLKSKGIVTSIVHERNDKYTIFKPFKRKLPKMDEFEKRYVSIPCGWWVSEKDAKFIVGKIKEFYGGKYIDYKSRFSREQTTCI